VSDGPMPPDPFSGAQDDWSGLASGLHGFFSALMASGFTEGQALHLTAQYQNALLAVMMNAVAARQPPAQEP
jgi:hypothetical protein